MPRFFVSDITPNFVVVDGENAKHISRSLRMKIGDEITLCDGKGYDYHGIIEQMNEDVLVKIIKKVENKSEPTVKARLYQALPKGDKFEQIVQKAVELGVYEIVPVLTSRCISRPDAKSMRKKCERYNKIAYEAAKQSGRGILPIVRDLITFRQAVQEIAQSDADGLMFYECGGKRLPELVSTDATEVSFLIGSEGGFEPSEVALAQQNGIGIASLGERILRCETAPLCALSVVMFYTQNI